MSQVEDFERLEAACTNLMECIAAAQKHKNAEWIRWRLTRLRQETFEFKSMVFPETEEGISGKDAGETKGDNEQ